VTDAAGGAWSIERRVDTAAALHASWPAPTERRGRMVGVCTVVGRSALVLGSTQRTEAVDMAGAARAEVEIVRRSSGGAAVLVGPAAQVWLDVWVPRADPLWDDDVISSSWWLGETWARALEGLGAPPMAVHRGRATRTAWSDAVCFAGVGPGEVTIGTTKVVGVAQRRSADGARLHSMAMVSWQSSSLRALLSLDDTDHGPVGSVEDELDAAATGLRDILPSPWRHADPSRIISAVVDALLIALP
jgi:lipoate-protein ligase A